MKLRMVGSWDTAARDSARRYAARVALRAGTIGSTAYQTAWIAAFERYTQEQATESARLVNG